MSYKSDTLLTYGKPHGFRDFMDAYVFLENFIAVSTVPVEERKRANAALMLIVGTCNVPDDVDTTCRICGLSLDADDISHKDGSCNKCRLDLNP